MKKEKVVLMEYPKEQILMIHNIFWKEINLLKMNLHKFMQDSERCQKLISELCSTDGVTKSFGLLVFDRYMTQMVTAFNMARKYNIHLAISSLEQTVISDSSACLDDSNFMQPHILKLKRSCFENDMSCEYAGRIKMTEHISDIIDDHGKNRMKLLELSKNNETNIKSVTDKTINIPNKIESLLKNVLPKQNLSNFRSGFEFEACVVYVRDYKKLEFFVCLKNDYKTLYDISSNIKFRPISKELLPPDDVFCVLEKGDARECLCRTVLVPKECNDKTLMYLIDFGEFIHLTDHCEAFEAPLRYRQIPPLAIKCILAGVEDSFLKCTTYDRDNCKQALLKHEFEKANYRVVHKENQILTVVMLQTRKTVESASSVENNDQKNPFVDNTRTFCESDDQNSSTNSAALQLPISTVYEEPPAKYPVLNIFSEVGNQIQVVVTHVTSPMSFYGIIQSDYDYSDHKIFSWHDQQIFTYQKQMSPPHINEMVLAQYFKDGYWYRAKIINIDSQKNFYTVFYVDFGNTEVVPLGSLAKCSKEQLKDPPRAVLFHLSNLSIISDEENVHSSDRAHVKSVIEIMVVMILEQTINVEVTERRNNDLVVRLIDSQYVNIPKMLIDMGVVKEI